MPDVCPNCKTLLTKKDKYCPVCNKYIENTDDKPKKKSHPRLKRCLPYLVTSLVSLMVFTVCFVMFKRTIPPEISAEKTGIFSQETLFSERYFPFFNIMSYAFLFLTAIFVGFAIYCFCAKPKENRKFNLYALCFSLLLCITTGTVIFAYTKHYFERDRIDVLAKDEIIFSMSVVHDEKPYFDKNFENSMYTYYSTFCHAYNDLARTGDYKAFFDRVNENNFPSLTHNLTLLKRYHISNGYKTAENTKLIHNLLPSQIPFKSIESGAIPSNNEILRLAGNYKNIKALDIIVKKYVVRANVLFDIFYGKELIRLNYTMSEPMDYIGTYCHSFKKNVLTISAINFDKNGNGEVEFTYSNIEKPIKCKLNNRRASFRCEDTSGNSLYGMLHLSGDKIIVNISCKEKYLNSGDSFQSNEKNNSIH